MLFRSSTLFQQQTDIVWGLIASMFIGNIILAFLNIPMAGLLVRVLAVPPKILYPIVLGLTFIGTYAISYATFDFFILLIFGVLGYFLAKAKFPTSPLVLAVIVGTSIEQSFRRAYKVSDGNLLVFAKSPLCIILLILTIGSILLPVISPMAKSWKNSVMEKIAARKRAK